MVEVKKSKRAHFMCPRTVMKRKKRTEIRQTTITAYMTARSNQKIVFEIEKKGKEKKFRVEIPAGLTEEQIQTQLSPLKELFESL